MAEGDFNTDQFAIDDFGFPATPNPLFAPLTREEADGFFESISAGWQESTGGLIKRQESPEVVLAKEPELAERIAFMVGRTVGDMPTLVLGYAAGAPAGAAAGAPVGGAIGSVVPGAGTLVGAAAGTVAGQAIGGGAGAMALTEGVRAWLIDQYNTPEGADFEEIIDRLAISFTAAGKGAAIGGATAGVGRFVGGTATVAAMPAAARFSSVTAAELTTMVTVARGLEGELPRGEDFVDGAILLAGFKGAGKLGGRGVEVVSNANRRLQERFIRNAERPLDTAAEALVNANLRAKLLSEKDAQIARDLIGNKMDQNHSARKVLADDPYTALVDDTNPLKIFEEGTKLDGATSAHKLVRTARGLAGAVTGRLERLTRDMPKEPGFADGLRSFLIASRALELTGRGIESGIASKDIPAMQRVVKGASKETKKAAKKIRDFQDGLVREAVDNGLISNKQAVAMLRLNKDYIPFKRLFTEEDGAVNVKGGSPFKTIKGSERKIQDPLESVIENTMSIMRMMEQNNINKALINVKPGKFKVVKQPGQVTKLTEAERKKFAKQVGGEEIGLPELTVFRRQAIPITDSQVSVFVGGKRTVYEVGKELAGAARSIDPYLAPGWLRVLSIPAKTLRALTIISPDFIIRNFLRDQVTAATFTRSKYRPFVDFVGGWMEFVGKGPVFERWRAAGGENSSIAGADRMLRDTFSFSQPKPWNTNVNPFVFLRNVSESVENATRVAEFGRAEKAGLSQKEAAFRSREITIDFARKGQGAARAFNQVTAFLNVQIQGVDRFVRALKADPKGAAAKMALYVTMPSVTLWMFNHDQPWYKEVPQWQKDLFWIFSPDGGETIYRMPKPHEIGYIFGSVPEHILDSMFEHDPKAMKSAVNGLWQHFMPDIVPTGAAPFYEAETNRTFHTDAPVLRSDIEDLLPEYQYTEYTSPVAKALGELLGYTMRSVGLEPSQRGSIASPATIEHFYNSWTGSIGRAFMDTVDLLAGKFSGNDPDPTLSDIPFIKAFVVRHPSGGSESIKRFMDEHRKIRSVAQTVDKLIERGEGGEAVQVMQKHQARLIELNSVNKALTQMRHTVRQIWTLPKAAGVPPQEKRQLIDELYRGMINTAKNGNLIIQEFKDLVAEDGLELE